jgi:hypothetical protein
VLGLVAVGQRHQHREAAGALDQGADRRRLRRVQVAPLDRG